MGAKRFSPQRNFNKKNIEKVSADKPIVYKLLGADEKILYTGISKRSQGQDRLKDHLADGDDAIPGARKFQVKEMSSIEQAKKEEHKIIQEANPKFNEKP